MAGFLEQLHDMRYFREAKPCLRCKGVGAMVLANGCHAICHECGGRGFNEYIVKEDELEAQMVNEIPDLDETRSPYKWRQPHASEIFCNDQYAYMSQETYDRLVLLPGAPHYCVGMMWRSSQVSLSWYALDSTGSVFMYSRRIIIGE